MKHWKEYSSNPNAPKILELRSNEIRQARARKLVDDRIAYLCSLVSGKSVLDIGVIEHTSSAYESQNWLHAHLRRHASQCLGVDVLQSEISELRAKGYNVLCADITSAPLPERFDIIVAGEVIEHVDSPGRFMQNCAAMLTTGGKLVITTPNPWYINAITKSCWGSRPLIESTDHIAWYEPSVLYELGQRFGLRLERYTGVGNSLARSVSGKVFFGMRGVLIALGFRKELFAKSIIYEFVSDENTI